MYQGRGRPPKPPWQSVTGWRHALAPEAWARLTVRDGEKGPVAIEMVRRRVQTRLDRKRTGPDEWLVVTLSPRGRGHVEGASITRCRRSGYPLWVSLLSDPDVWPTEPWRNRRWGNWRASSKRERAMNYLAASCEVSNPAADSHGPASLAGSYSWSVWMACRRPHRTPPIGHLDDAVAYRLVHCLAAAHIGG